MTSRISKPSPRLFAIVAREAPIAVIFRRGPSKEVQLIKWHTADDTFEAGQWFKGRVYERRGDLSPDGTKLLYFAANYKKPLFSWTAVSRIPYFSALLLWPQGDGWGGGGLFDSPEVISLNHHPDRSQLKDGFQLPQAVVIQPFGKQPGEGEDHPVYHARLIRDGWRSVSEGVPHDNGHDAPIRLVFDPPVEYRKAIRLENDDRQQFELAMRVEGIREKQSGWYVVSYGVYDRRGQQVADLGKADWADWDKNHDLLFAKDGKLFRLKPNLQTLPIYDPARARELADFTANTFEAKPPPDTALRW